MAGSGAGAKIRDKRGAGAKNKQFRLRNTVLINVGSGTSEENSVQTFFFQLSWSRTIKLAPAPAEKSRLRLHNTRHVQRTYLEPCGWHLRGISRTYFLSFSRVHEK